MDSTSRQIWTTGTQRLGPKLFRLNMPLKGLKSGFELYGPYSTAF